MSKKSVIEREKKRQKIVLAFSKKRQQAIFDLKKSIGFEEKLQASFMVQKLPRNSSKVRLRNRCEITGRPKGVYRFFKISRSQIRLMASKAFLPGLHKSSW